MINTDYIFIGSGAASSFAIAWLIKNTNKTITVIEAGDSTYNRFNKDKIFSPSSRDLVSSSMMAIQTGGSLNLWSGRLGLLDKSDFEINQMYSKDFFSSYEDYLFWVSEVLKDHFNFNVDELTDQIVISSELEAHISKWRTPPLNFRNQLLEWSQSGRIKLVEETEIVELKADSECMRLITTLGQLLVAKTSAMVLGAGTLGNWKILKNSGYIEEDFVHQFSYHPKATIGRVSLTDVIGSSFLCDRKYGSDNIRYGFKLSEEFKNQHGISSNSYVQIESTLASSMLSLMEKFQLRYSLENIRFKKFMERIGMYLFSIVNRMNIHKGGFNLKIYVDNTPNNGTLTLHDGKFKFKPYQIQFGRNSVLGAFKNALKKNEINLELKTNFSVDCNLHSHLIGGLTNIDKNKLPKNLEILGLGEFPRCGNINPTLSLAAYSYKKIKQLNEDSK
jgi:hypothetical protein